jgi:hypothetical protein
MSQFDQKQASAVERKATALGLIRESQQRAADFTFLPILRLSAARFRTSQIPKPVLAREGYRVC